MGRDARVVISPTPKPAEMASREYAEPGPARVIEDLAEDHGRVVARRPIEDSRRTAAEKAMASDRPAIGATVTHSTDRGRRGRMDHAGLAGWHVPIGGGGGVRGVGGSTAVRLGDEVGGAGSGRGAEPTTPDRYDRSLVAIPEGDRPAWSPGGGVTGHIVRRSHPPCESGTHAVCGAAIKPIRHGEASMPGQPPDDLGPGMPPIRGRGSFGFEPIESARDRGAHPLAWAKSNSVPGPTRHPDDGSYPAPIYPSRADRRRDRDGPAVRVIEYTHDDPGRPGVGRRHRPIAGQLDPADPPALEAPPARHERWEEGPARDEIETHPSGRAAAIRSETPAGVVREICGLMLAHHAARRVMHDAAAATHDPDRLSFIDSSRVPQCRLPESPGPGIEPWYRPLLTEVWRRELRPPARPPVCPRDRAEDVELEEEAGASATAAADENLQGCCGSAYLTGIEARPGARGSGR